MAVLRFGGPYLSGECLVVGIEACQGGNVVRPGNSGDRGARESWSRALTEADLGFSGTTQLTGSVSFSAADRLMTVKVDMIEMPGGTGNSWFGARRSLLALARASGARRLRVEASFANPRLLEILRSRWNIITAGAIEYIEFEVM